MKTIQTLLASVVLLSFLAPFLSGQNASPPQWNFFRGPNYDGHSQETSIADSWPDEGPPVLWVRELGQGYSSFVGRGNRIFTMYQTVTQQYVICLNAESGETIWERSFDWSFATAGLYPGPRSTPTLDGDRLYFTSPKGVLRCLNQSDGKLIWEVNLPQTFNAEQVTFGYACSPVIVNEKVILPVGGEGSSVVALDKNDGSTIWKSGNSKISYASILPVTKNGKRLLFAFLQNKLILMDEESGKEISSIQLSSGYDEHSAWPIYREPYLWISAPFRMGSRLIKITDSEPSQLTTVWQSDMLSNDVCSSVLVDDHLYGFDISDVQAKVHRPSRGSYRCLEFLSGKSSWQNGNPRARRELDGRDSDLAKNSVGHSSTIYADSKLILLSDTGDLILLKADPSQFQELARVRVLGGQINWTQPMLLNRRLYLRNHSRAVCVYLGEPDELATSTASVLTVSDIPQGTNFDLAKLLMPVEPEYAMDAPTVDSMIRWYWIMLASGWLVAFPLGAILFYLGGGKNVLSARATYRVLSIVLGVLGTPLFSLWFNEFIFTWPLVLGIAFEILVFQMKTRKQMVELKANPKRLRIEYWMGRLAFLFFLVVCLVYFFMCRRLSLAFEWSFLLGFPAAIPFLIVCQFLIKKIKSSWKQNCTEWLLTGLAFSAFYWAGAIVVAIKY